jgi:hypothetical protein
MPWIGPHKLRSYLDRIGGVPDPDLPPEIPGLYVVTEQTWTAQPSRSAGALYVGKSGVLRARIGEFVSSACGFHGTYAGRHSGGITVNEKYVRLAKHNPLDVWIACLPMQGALPDQVAKAESELIGKLHPSCNKK